ncbi:hypothetical protein QTH97_26195 [Variovorax sp. J22R24]|uniref:hypothetical protein n=1 Tax=Variovorax gracilis TaxID=3053502 RepID=UPI0025770B8B|nr:hypothetical protein [Variovorax sp. J22R24]MDM0108467.1 hypothetical protein [Variovorax sp. J22R24]
MNPASAQHAALRILLEDVDPLLQRAEEAAQSLTKVREELSADLTTLGSLVQQSLDAQPLMLEAGRKLSGSAARIEAAIERSNPPANSAPNGIRIPVWVACSLSATLSAALVTGTVWLGSRDVLEQARIGRALMSAWPSLDAATRIKVHELIGRS